MLKVILYETVVNPVMIYGSECQAVDKNIEHSMNMEEIKILRLMSEVNREDKIRN